MSETVRLELNKASEAQIACHLSRCEDYFFPRLSDRVELVEYAGKIASKAMRVEAWSGNTLVGLVAEYCNDRGHCIAYITSVSVLNEWTGKGIATRLMQQCIECAKTSGMRQISLEVSRNNASAIALYEKLGFVVGSAKDAFITMNLILV